MPPRQHDPRSSRARMPRSRSRAFRDRVDSLEDLAVPGAAADVPRERLADLRVARLGVALQERLRGHDEPRRAEAALHGTGFHERHLERMHFSAARESLDRLYLLVRARSREHEAAA